MNMETQNIFNILIGLKTEIAIEVLSEVAKQFDLKLVDIDS